MFAMATIPLATLICALSAGYDHTAASFLHMVSLYFVFFLSFFPIFYQRTDSWFFFGFPRGFSPVGYGHFFTSFHLLLS